MILSHRIWNLVIPIQPFGHQNQASRAMHFMIISYNNIVFAAIVPTCMHIHQFNPYIGHFGLLIATLFYHIFIVSISTESRTLLSQSKLLAI